MSEQHETAIQRIETALQERYRVSSLEGVGVLGDAIKAARSGDLGPLDAALAGRELYRWRESVDAALAELQGTKETPAEASADELVLPEEAELVLPDEEPPAEEAPKKPSRK